jgi:hypothetical protein
LIAPPAAPAGRRFIEAQGEQNEKHNFKLRHSDGHHTDNLPVSDRHLQQPQTGLTNETNDNLLLSSNNRLNSGGHDSGSRQPVDRTGNEINNETQNSSRAPLYDRTTRLRALPGANFRVAQPLGLGHRNRKIGAAGEVNSPLPSEQVSLLPSEQVKPLETLLPSEQSESDKRKAEWLKTLLPELTGGWWDVAANGKGFIIKQKWREQKRQITQTYPRVSREQFQTLKGSNYAKQIISDRIRGHLDECQSHKLKATRERARCAAARLSASY